MPANDHLHGLFDGSDRLVAARDLGAHPVVDRRPAGSLDAPTSRKVERLVRRPPTE